MKKNVSVFNGDVKSLGGYRYTITNQVSSILANKRQTEIITSLINNKDKTILDIGCGDGKYTNEIKKSFPKAQVTGIEPAGEAISIAKHNYPNIEFIVGDFLKSSALSNHHYDIAVMRGVLHHMSEQKLPIKKAFEVADKLLIVEPNGNNPLLKIIEKTSKYHIEHEEQSFRPSKIKQWCLEVGWKIDHFCYIGFVPFFCPDLLARSIYFFQPLLEKIPIVKSELSASSIFLCSKKRGKN
jgi:2-polyprenyl-3-methyl-5-hydroxy-6-metoxy-1,4-benzoquinol methylase